MAVLRNKCRCSIILQNLQHESRLGGYLTCSTKHSTHCLLIDAVFKNLNLWLQVSRSTHTFMFWWTGLHILSMHSCFYATLLRSIQACGKRVKLATLCSQITTAETSTTPQCWHLPSQSESDNKVNTLSCTKDFSFIQNKQSHESDTETQTSETVKRNSDVGEATAQPTCSWDLNLAKEEMSD